MTASLQGGVMPWKELSVLEQRLAVVHQVLTAKRPLAQVAREFGVSRKTLYKWLTRHRQAPLEPQTLADRSRRPRHSPTQTDDAIEQAVLAVRRQHNWGPRKIHRLLGARHVAMPSIRTVATILSRHGCVRSSSAAAPPMTPALPPRSFERSAPNELWQLDHKGPLEVARQRVTPLAVIDDHSRYCLCFTALTDVTTASAWNVLWQLFGEVGLPQALLCDNAFGGRHHTVGLSWFDALLVRLQINPLHGRPYHPQTQGKVERLNGTAQRELIDFHARRDSIEHFEEDGQRWRMTYNTVRPHEALGDLPPVTRWQPSVRPRPATLPQISYPPGVITRRVSHAGDFRYRNARIVVGRALCGQSVRIEEREHDIAVYYAWKQLRVIPAPRLGGRRSDAVV
jgi:transposase InsO family protein